MKLPAWWSQSSTMRKVVLSFLALLGVCLALTLVLLILLATQRRASPEKASDPRQAGIVITEEGPAFMRLLLLPEKPFSSLPFPLDTSRNTRYSKEELDSFRPEFPAGFLRELEQRRKEQLETIFSSVD